MAPLVRSFKSICFIILLLFEPLPIVAMRIVIQRVKSASVTIDINQKPTAISTIGPGIMALVGIHIEDTKEDLEWCVKRLLSVKLWENESGAAWRQHVKQKDYEILCVSQFTLYGTLSKKNTKPNYELAMKSIQAEELYNSFLETLRSGYEVDKIKDGRFGAMMDVALVNDGPVTLIIDSREEKMSSRVSSVESISEG